jgi:pyruvate/2-oxoglutarate dehydrogenase complex dihydrolipoamide acyltransferase (E2) component
MSQGNDVMPLAAPEPAVPDGYEGVPHERVRLKMRRRAAARNLTVSASIPSLTADVQVDLTVLLAVRHEWNSQPGCPGRLSVFAFLARAAASTLLEFPDLNATFLDTELIRWTTVNLGIAVDTARGLVVPVIRDAQKYGVQQIGDFVRDLGARARDGGISSGELSGGTFTLSNPGSIGPAIRAEALLNPPQVALLGFPGVSREPVVVTDASGAESIEIRSILRPSLTFDHRALDGGEAIRFLVGFRDKVQGWNLEQYQT